MKTIYYTYLDIILFQSTPFPTSLPFFAPQNFLILLVLHYDLCLYLILSRYIVFRFHFLPLYWNTCSTLGSFMAHSFYPNAHRFIYLENNFLSMTYCYSGTRGNVDNCQKQAVVMDDCLFSLSFVLGRRHDINGTV